MSKRFFICTLLVCLFACNPATKVGTKDSNGALIENKILFLTIEARKSGSELSFEIVGQQLVDGRIKKPMPSHLNVPNYLKFVFNDINGKSITEVAIENPLTKSVEVPEENGSFSRQKLNLDKSSIVLRIQYTKKVDTISILDESEELVSTLKVKL